MKSQTKIIRQQLRSKLCEKEIQTPCWLPSAQTRKQSKTSPCQQVSAGSQQQGSVEILTSIHPFTKPTRAPVTGLCERKSPITCLKTTARLRWLRALAQPCCGGWQGGSSSSSAEFPSTGIFHTGFEQTPPHRVPLPPVSRASPAQLGVSSHCPSSTWHITSPGLPSLARSPAIAG